MGFRGRWLPVLNFFFALSAFLQGPFASAGGVSDGGGNLCYLNGTPYLLEFAHLHSQLQEKGIQLGESNMSQLYGFSEYQSIYGKDRLKQRIDTILAANEASSPIFVSWLKPILAGLQFSVTSIPIEAPVAADTTDQPLCRSGNVRASVLFFPPHMGFVDRGQFNALDLDSQAGLLIHEAVRFIQHIVNGTISGNPSNGKFTDLDLQRATRTLFDVYRQGSSDGIPSLDRESLFEAIADQVSITPERDLCLKSFTFEEAKKNLLSKKMPLRRGSKSARGESGPNLSEVWDEQERIEAAFPPIFEEICKATYSSMQWFALKERLDTWQGEIEKTLSDGENRREKMEMLSVLRKTREAPLRSGNLREKALRAVPDTIGSLSLLSAYMQLNLVRVSISANSYYETKKSLWKAFERRDELRSVERSACRFKNNIGEFFRTGTLVEHVSREKTFIEFIDQPHPRCE